jgi:3-oxoacyl-[acyl-carrier-protein] synthase III
MAWIAKVEQHDGTGRMHPTKVIAHVKIFSVEDGAKVVQIETLGSAERQIPDKISQTFQLGKEAARQLFDILKDTYGFR